MTHLQVLTCSSCPTTTSSQYLFRSTRDCGRDGPRRLGGGRRGRSRTVARPVEREHAAADAVRGARVLGTKLVSVVPGNTARALPVTNGLMILNEGDTGLPLAVMNAAALTAVRTGAVGAVGLRYMTPEDVSRSESLDVGCRVRGRRSLPARCGRFARSSACRARARASSASVQRLAVTPPA